MRRKMRKSRVGEAKRAENDCKNVGWPRRQSLRSSDLPYIDIYGLRFCIGTTR